MKSFYVFAGFAVMVVILFLLSGCAALIPVNERALTLDDIIAMSKAEVSVDVIKTHIDATHSKFTLTTDDIIKLKNAGVKDETIEYMLESGSTPDTYWWEYGYAPYYYGYNYYNRYYYPYSNYFYYGLPYQYSPFWGGYRRLYWNPYGTYRAPGLIGRFYYYYPQAPFWGEDLYTIDRYRHRRDMEKREWDRLERRAREDRDKELGEPER